MRVFTIAIAIAMPRALVMIAMRSRCDHDAIRCERVLAVGADGALRATDERDAETPSMVRFEAHGRRTPWGEHVRYGDDVAVKIKARSGKWRYVDVAPAKKTPSAEPDAEPSAEPSAGALIARAQWEERDSTWQKLRVLGFCELTAVPLRAGDKFYLRAVGAAANLTADADADDDERDVCASAGDARGANEAIEAIKR